MSDARPVSYRLHEYEPAAHFEAVTRPFTVLGELLWYHVLHADVDFADSYEPEESRAHTITHGRRVWIVIATAVALSQFV